MTRCYTTSWDLTTRRPAILVDQTAEHVPSFDGRSGSPLDLRRSVTGGHGQAQSPMWSLRHVVRDVRPEHSLEVPTTVARPTRAKSPSPP